MESGVNCRDCLAVCCRAGNRYSLKSSEAASMGLTNENMVYSPHGDLMNDRLPVYELGEDCPNLVQETEKNELPEFQCALYDDPTRPGCCTFIKPGGEYCLSARKKFGYNDAKPETLEEFVCEIPSLSGVRSQESGVRSQESGVRSQESGVRSQESGKLLLKLNKFTSTRNSSHIPYFLITLELRF